MLGVYSLRRRRRPLMSEYAGQQFVGIDLHRRRSVLVRTTAEGEVLETVRILNDIDRLTSVIARAGECPEVVLEATYGWYWAVDALQGRAPGSIWRTRWVSRRSSTGGSRTMSGTRRIWRICCGWGGCPRRG
jgi:hypothetical protein